MGVLPRRLFLFLSAVAVRTNGFRRAVEIWEGNDRMILYIPNAQLMESLVRERNQTK